MNKAYIKNIFLVILFILACIYGVNLFQTISYNRRVLAIDIYKYIPKDADYIVNFNRNHHFEEYLSLDTTNTLILNALIDNITYPLLLIKEDQKDDLLLCKVTKEQEKQIKDILEHKIAPYHQPMKRKEDNQNIYFYSLPKNKFIVVSIQDGVLAISLDYLQIENFTQNKEPFDNISVINDKQINYQIEKIRANSPISFLIHNDSTIYSLAYSALDDRITLEGKYFGKLCCDSNRLSYNEMNHILRLESHYIDSINWEKDCSLKILINKSK